MQPTSLLCRAQQALQHERAASTTLESVRGQALLAAAAWAKEADAAEHRERRKSRTQEAAAALLRAAPAGDGERWFSENPDRGHADRLG